LVSDIRGGPQTEGVSEQGVENSRRMRWAGNVARLGEKRNAYRILVGKPELKKPLGRPRRRWVVNVLKLILER
jgi:hypothetical protein